MLRIERFAGREVAFTLSGRIQVSDIDRIGKLLDVEAPGLHLILDLRDLTLVCHDAVTFLAKCEINGIEIRNCPPYIRTWVDQEKCRGRRRRRHKEGFQ
jgi:hypothetical protein